MIFQESRHLIERLTKKLQITEDPGRIFYPRRSHIKTSTKFTGLPQKVLFQLLTDNNVHIDMKIEPIDRSVIYKKLVFFYLNIKKIPCTWELFESLHSEIPMYIDIGTFRKILVKMDFIWKKTRAGSVILEKPQVRLDRYNYLKNIVLQEQLNGSNVYYVDDFGVDLKGNLMDYKLTKAHMLKENAHNNMLRVIYALGEIQAICLDQISEFSAKNVIDWVKDSLLDAVTKPSVFVFKTVPHHSQKNLETPTLDSSKRTMMQWLDHHEITYCEEMSKYQLFALAEKFTDLNKELYTIDQILEANGHTVLRIPKCIEYLTPTALLMKAVDDILPELVSENKDNVNSDNIFTMLKEVVNTTASVHLEDFNRHIMELVLDYIQKENEVDEVFDSLLLKADISGKPTTEDSDVPSCSDSD